VRQERSSFASLLSETLLVDTMRALHPDAEGAFTYFSLVGLDSPRFA
jgi:exonuclease III